MKKFFLSSVTALALILGVNSQSHAQVQEGSILIDTYYGFPNFGKKLWSVLEDDSSTTNGKATGIGPLGLRFEYMLADNLGFGADINLLTNGFEYDYSSYDTSGNATMYHVKYSKTKLRVMARLNYHFVSTDAVDAYVGFGAGYKHKINKFSSTNPNDVEDELESSLNLVPVSIRICLGTRFFVTDYLGLNMEIGVGGGPLLSAGATIKF